jgi:hypothetical protein
LASGAIIGLSLGVGLWVLFGDPAGNFGGLLTRGAQKVLASLQWASYPHHLYFFLFDKSQRVTKDQWVAVSACKKRP